MWKVLKTVINRKGKCNLVDKITANDTEITDKQEISDEMNTVFPRINARGVYFKIRDFRGRSFEGAFIRGGAFISKFQK